MRAIAAGLMIAAILVTTLPKALSAADDAGPANAKDSLPGLVPAPRTLPGIGRWQLAHKIPRGRIYAIAWSPDGKKLAYSESNYVRICDAQTFEAERFLVGHSGRVTAIDWNRATNRIATGSLDKTVRLWSAQGVPEKILTGHAGEVNDVAWTADGKRLASAGSDGKVRIWNSDGALLHAVNASDALINSLAWHPDGSRFVIGDDNHQVKLWNADGTPGPVCEGHLGRVNAVAWSPAGDRFASSTWGYKSEDTNQYVVDVRIWKVDGSAAGQPRTSNLPNYGLRWSPDGKSLAVVDEGGTLSFIGPNGETRTQRKVPNIGGAMDEPSLAWNPDGTEIAVGGSGGVTVVDAADPVRVRSSQISAVARMNLTISNVVAVSADGNRVIMNRGQPVVASTYWNLSTGLAVEAPSNVVKSGLNEQALSHRGDQVIYIDEESQLAVWNPDKKTSDVVARPKQKILLRAWSPDDGQIAFSDEDRTVRVVKRNGDKVLEWSPKPAANGVPTQDQQLAAIMWSADGKAIIVGERGAAHVVRLDGTVAASFDFGSPAFRFWISRDNGRAVAELRGQSGTELKTWIAGAPDSKRLDGLPESIETIAVSPDGAWLVAGYDSGEWEKRTLSDPSTAPQITPAHVNGSVMRVEISPDGRHFATGGWDAVIKIWTSGGTLERTLIGQTHPIYRLWWSSDGKRLVSSTRTQSVCGWSLDKGRRDFALFPSEDGTGLLVLADGRIGAADPNLAAQELVVLVEEPNGATRIVDTADFLKRNDLIIR